MKYAILFTAPLEAPGPLTAFRNHKAILEPYFDCQIIPFEELVFPHLPGSKGVRSFSYRIFHRIMTTSVKRLLPFGDNIIFGTFAPIHESLINRLNKKGIRPSVMWCSTLGQIEMTPNERASFSRLIDFHRQKKIKYLLLHRRLHDSIGHFIQDAQFIPHSIDLQPYQGIEKSYLPGINLDLFCRVRPGKNIINQIAAFEMAQTQGTLHINFRSDQFRGILEKLTSHYTYHPWILPQDYFKLIAAMDLSLQVTIGESFNYAVCERMGLGIPVLTTPDIHLISDDPFLSQYLCVDAPDTPAVIARYIKRVIDEAQLRKDIAQQLRKRIADVARVDNQIVIDQFSKLFG